MEKAFSLHPGNSAEITRHRSSVSNIRLSRCFPDLCQRPSQQGHKQFWKQVAFIHQMFTERIQGTRHWEYSDGKAPWVRGYATADFSQTMRGRLWETRPGPDYAGRAWASLVVAHLTGKGEGVSLDRTVQVRVAAISHVAFRKSSAGASTLIPNHPHSLLSSSLDPTWTPHGDLNLLPFRVFEGDGKLPKGLVTGKHLW